MRLKGEGGWGSFVSSPLVTLFDTVIYGLPSLVGRRKQVTRRRMVVEGPKGHITRQDNPGWSNEVSTKGNTASAGVKVGSMGDSNETEGAIVLINVVKASGEISKVLIVARGGGGS